jgi:hypothetical protein
MKKKEVTNTKPGVRRITVDEQLEEELIRLSICNLLDGIEEFSDEIDEWDDEIGVLINPGNYAENMDIPKSKQKELEWIDLKEGRVFLSGEFVAKPSDEKPEKFIVTPGKQNFLCIDGMVNKEIKALYSRALERRKQNAKSDKA